MKYPVPILSYGEHAHGDQINPHNMSKKTYIKTSLYLLLIWAGYAIGEYPAIPTFKFLGIEHQQPGIAAYDRGIAGLLLVWSITLLLVFWGRFWARVSMVFICWGMFGNAIDEFSGRSGLFTTSEQIALLMALLITSIMIYRWKTK